MTDISSFKKITFISLGLFSTCSCVAFVGFGRVLSFYTIATILTYIILYKEKGLKIHVLREKASRYFTIWTIMGVLSCLFGLIFFIGDAEWMRASVSGLPKIVLYYLLFYLLLRNPNRDLYAGLIVKGLVWGLVINAIWATLDAIIFYVAGCSITNEIFRSYILAMDIRYESLSLINGPIIRSSGLNADPANIGMFAPILASYALYEKKLWHYMLAWLSIFASVSIVALSATAIITLIYIFANKKTLIYGVVVLFAIFIGITYLTINEESISGQMFGAVADRLEKKSESDASDKDNARMMYWMNFLPAIVTTPSALVIGTGYNTASYAYISGNYVNRSGAYDPEQTYFSTYFDVGLCGFLSFVCLLSLLLKKSFRSMQRYAGVMTMLFAGIEGSILSFAGYHYTLYSVSMLFIISGICLLLNNKTVKFV